MQEQKVLYVSIPMKGQDEKKQRATAKLQQRYYEAEGFKVINPFELGDRLQVHHIEKGLLAPTYDQHMAHDLKHLEECTHIVFCKFWANSDGCVREADRALERKLIVMPRIE